MVVFIQTKPTNSDKLWEKIPQRRLKVANGRTGRIFAKQLSLFLLHNVRLTFHRPDGNGTYFSPNMT